MTLEQETPHEPGADQKARGERNARIIFVPEKDAEYRVIATTLIQAYGDFALMVRAVKE